MKKYLHLFLSASILTTLVSCIKEQTTEDVDASADKLTIEAYFADDMAVKNCIDDAGTIYWTPNDSISVFFGDYSFPFYSYNSKPVTRANFIGSAWIAAGTNAEYDETSDEYNYWGVYPLRTNDFMYRTVKNGEGVMCFIDEKQTAVEGTFDRSTFVTVACSHDYTKLAFYNLCGGVRFKVTSSDIDMVTFSGNNGEALGGEVLVKMDSEGHPYPAEHNSDIKTIRLQAPSGTTFKPGVWYYIVTLPTELSNGFTMKFISKKNNRMAVLKKESNFNIARSHFGSLTNPEEGLEHTAYDGSEDERQLENKIFVKSVKMKDDGSFEFDLGYPSVEVQRLCEKYKVKITITPEYQAPYEKQYVQHVSDDLFIIYPAIVTIFDRDKYSDLYMHQDILDMTYEDEYRISYYLESLECGTIFYNSSTGKFICLNDYSELEYIGADSNSYYFINHQSESGIVTKLNRESFVYEQYGCFGNIEGYNSYYRKKFFMYDGKYPSLFGNDYYDGNLVFACIISKDNLKYSIQENCTLFSPDEEYNIIHAGTASYFIGCEGSATKSYYRSNNIYYMTVEDDTPQIIKKAEMYAGYDDFSNEGNNHIISYSKEKMAIIINGGFYYKLAENGAVIEGMIPDKHIAYTNNFFCCPISIDVSFSSDFKTCYYVGLFQDYPYSANIMELCVKDLISGEKIISNTYNEERYTNINDCESGYYQDHRVAILHGYRVNEVNEDRFCSVVIDFEANRIYSAKDGLHVDKVIPKYNFYIKQ